MNKVITINLGGNAYQLEEGAYDLLRPYLETAAARLRHNPDQEEILSDIESAIAEKFRQRLSGQKNVVTARDAATVLEEMGPVQADAESGEAAKPAGPGYQAGPAPEDPAKPKRLYRIYDGAMVSGVCNGIGAYLNIDPTLVRLAFVLLAICWGMGLLTYLILVVLVPVARSPEEKAAASGLPPTAQEFIRRAKAGYYEAVKNFQTHRQGRAWGRWFRWHACMGANPWKSPWRRGWAPSAAYCPPWIGFAVLLLTLLSGALTIAWLCALTSLLATGLVFGAALPAGLPIWAAAALLLFIYAMLAGSLKTARWLSWWGHSHSGRPPAGVLLGESLVWLMVTLALLVLAVHFFPELRAAVQAIPGVAHQGTEAVQKWWQTR